MLVQLAGPTLMIVAAEFAPVAARLREAAPDAQVLELGREGSLEWQLARSPIRHRSGPIERSAAGHPAVHLGHTGRPKGVMVTAGNAAATARNYSLSARVDAGSVFLCDMPMFHVVGLFTVTNTDAAGWRHVADLLAVPAGRNPQRLADPALGVTHYFCVPQMAKQLREHAAFEPRHFRRLTAMQTGGAPHSAEAVRPGSTTACVASTGTG